MKKIKVFCFFALLFSFISCNKDENPSSLADKVVGTYHGTTYFGTAHLSCTSIITKTADAMVKLSIYFNGSSFIFAEIGVFNGVNNTYILSYSDQSGTLDGKVEGNALTYNVSSGVLVTVFTGSR
jgi:hypothetical protein